MIKRGSAPCSNDDDVVETVKIGPRFYVSIELVVGDLWFREVYAERIYLHLLRERATIRLWSGDDPGSGDGTYVDVKLGVT